MTKIEAVFKRSPLIFELSENEMFTYLISLFNIITTNDFLHVREALKNNIKVIFISESVTQLTTLITATYLFN